MEVCGEHPFFAMEMDQIAAFLEVAQLHSFSRAAEKLYRTQPAISAQIRSLEQELHQKLFDRSGRKIFLTPAGEILFEYGLKLQAMHRETMQRVRETRDEIAGSIVVGANEATCLYVLPNVFAEYKRKYPQVAIEIYHNFSHKIIQRMNEHQVDLGIVTLPVTQKNIKVIPLHEDEVHVVLPAKHPLAKRASLKIEDLVSEPLIFPKGGHTRDLLERIFRKYRNRLQISMELASVESIKKFVGAGLGISLLTRSYATMETKTGVLKLVPIQGLKIVRRLGLAYKTDRQLSRAAQAFWDVVASMPSQFLH